MRNPLISINQLAEFSKASASVKKRILHQQLVPNKLLIPWYQSAKASMKQYFKNVEDITPLLDGIKKLENKPIVTKRQLVDRTVSIEALNKLKYLSLPVLLKTINYELIKVDNNSLSLYGLEIKIAPDIIIKGKINEVVVYGAIKLHICKTKPFDLNQSKYISTLLYKFLTNKVVKNNEKVLPELCFCLDIFSERIVIAPADSSKENGEIKNLCFEINKIWETL